MDLLTYSLVTLENAKTFLGITSEDQDDEIKYLINQATDFIETKCGRRFAETDYAEQEISGTGARTIQLPQFPVISFTKLEVNNNSNNSDNWSEIDSESYWVDTDSGVIEKTTVFALGKNRYRASYSAGYATIPYDIQYACLALVSEAMNKRKGAGIKSESLGDHSITFESVLQLNDTVKEIFANYRDIDLGEVMERSRSTTEYEDF